MLARLAVVATLGISTLAVAAPRKPAVTVTRVSEESQLVLRPLAAGATVLERYRAARTPLVHGKDVVAIIRLPPLNSPDHLDVTATASGNHVAVAITTHRYTGALSANDVTTPYVEVALGALAAGSYRIEIKEHIVTFDDLAHPDVAKTRTGGLSADASFEVQ